MKFLLKNQRRRGRKTARGGPQTGRRHADLTRNQKRPRDAYSASWGSAFNDVEPQHEPEQVLVLGHAHGVKRFLALSRNEFVAGVVAQGRNSPKNAGKLPAFWCTRAANLARSTFCMKIPKNFPQKAVRVTARLAP